MMDVSIIIPYKKDRGYLGDAIRAAWNQEFSGKYEILPQQGDFLLGKNFNDAVKKSQGKWLKVCAEDDLLTPNCLQDLFDFAEKGNYDFVCANAINFNNKNEQTVYKSIIPKTVSLLAQRNQIHGGTTLYRKQSLVDVGYWDEFLRTGEEWEFSLRFASAGYKFGYIDKIVYKYRLWESQKSMAYIVKDKKKHLERKNYINKIRHKFINIHKKIIR